MSLAWGTLVLLLVLLPGVLFFVGMYVPEKFTRDAADRSAIGHLSGILLISLAVHGTLFIIAPLYCTVIPCVNVDLFLRALTLERASTDVLVRIANNISENRFWIALYIGVSAVVGMFLGWFTGQLIIGGKLEFLVQHRWAYRLSVDKLTTAWIMTHIHEGPRVLTYRGFLRYFHLKRDGTFSYVVLENVRRGYIELGADGPRASSSGNWPVMGRSTRQRDEIELPAIGHRYEESLFAIEGEDIANIVFDRYEVAFNVRMSAGAFRKIARTVLEERLKHVQMVEPDEP